MSDDRRGSYQFIARKFEKLGINLADVTTLGEVGGAFFAKDEVYHTGRCLFTQSTHELGFVANSVTSSSGLKLRLGCLYRIFPRTCCSLVRVFD